MYDSIIIITMKKILVISLLFPLLYLTSCDSYEEVETITKKQFVSKINDAINRDNTFINKPVISRQLPDSNATSSNAWDIAKADVEGAATGGGGGAAIGVGIGAGVGAIVGAVGGAGIGALPGAITGSRIGAWTGALIGGIVGATIYSITAAKNNSCTIVLTYSNIWNNRYKICLESPTNDDIFNFFPENRIGVDIGYYHNFLIKEILENNSIEDEITYDFVFQYAEDTELFTASNELQNLLQDDIAMSEYSSEYSTEYDFALSYIDNLVERPSNEWFSYINSVTSVVDSIARIYPEHIVSAAVINGALSTFYHSYCLWRTIVPDPNMFIPWVFIPETSSISIYNSSDWQQHIAYIQAQNPNIVLFTPQIINGQLIRLFVFRELNEDTFDDFINGTLSYSNSLSAITTNADFFNVPSTILLPDSLIIPEGNYPIDISPTNDACAITFTLN